jgi:predicted DNA-binding protein with PD1-like motif
MNVRPYSGSTELVVVGLQPGELLLESVQQAVRDRGIRNGAVVSGIGTLKTCTLHYIEHVNFPPTDRFFTLDKPLELLSVSGLIADGEPHLHVVVSCGENEVYAGHLEPGSEVAYLAELAILVFNGLEMTRVPDLQRKIKLLGRKP